MDAPDAWLYCNPRLVGKGHTLDVPRHVDAFTVQALYPNFYNEAWVSYTVKSVLENIATDGINVGVIAAGTDVRKGYVHGVTNKYLYRYAIPRFRSPMQSVFRAAR